MDSADRVPDMDEPFSADYGAGRVNLSKLLEQAGIK
ncbi:hypothetical protein FBZ94_101230 [Bradyrhizobium sacchari]|uniref:Uncharacterized protein n=1 Tax=Bradyrhizobium sacchari TaxID=1399419 RepID=A0A560J623_9BRAD|nr:hypothetical protein FBZ94_101230 [Bradyrhizobium sacchari]TWB83792.1 hypothetical protein FBZ95_101229 [Bradyrhizobium sacchari]